MLRLVWLWPIVLMLSTLATAVTTLFVPGLSVRPFVVIWFLFICPGMALIRFLHLNDSVAEWTLALALSLSVDAGLATLQLYAGIWLPIATISILMGLCFVCALVQIATILFDEQLKSRYV